MEQEGLFFLRPVYDVVFQDVNYLKLPRSSVSVCYKVYDNTYKDGNQIGPDGLSVDDAAEKKLTPGKIPNLNFEILLKLPLLI